MHHPENHSSRESTAGRLLGPSVSRALRVTLERSVGGAAWRAGSAASKIHAGNHDLPDPSPTGAPRRGRQKSESDADDLTPIGPGPTTNGQSPPPVGDGPIKPN